MGIVISVGVESRFICSSSAIRTGVIGDKRSSSELLDLEYSTKTGTSVSVEVREGRERRDLRSWFSDVGVGREVEVERKPPFSTQSVLGRREREEKGWMEGDPSTALGMTDKKLWTFLSTSDL